MLMGSKKVHPCSPSHEIGEREAVFSIRQRKKDRPWKILQQKFNEVEKNFGNRGNNVSVPARKIASVQKPA